MEITDGLQFGLQFGLKYLVFSAQNQEVYCAIFYREGNGNSAFQSWKSQGLKFDLKVSCHTTPLLPVVFDLYKFELGLYDPCEHVILSCQWKDINREIRIVGFPLAIAAGTE